VPTGLSRSREAAASYPAPASAPPTARSGELVAPRTDELDEPRLTPPRTAASTMPGPIPSPGGFVVASHAPPRTAASTMPGPIPSAEGFVAASHAPPRTAASTMPGPVPVLGAALPVLGPRAE